ncbi:MAG TPA: hypothetical protein VGO69_08675, partial [Pyrinomonadaceae bacterium]|nr:hypothetical protein [Pyrinomonadaceae bacterium]
NPLQEIFTRTENSKSPFKLFSGIKQEAVVEALSHELPGSLLNVTTEPLKVKVDAAGKAEKDTQKDFAEHV